MIIVIMIVSWKHDDKNDEDHDDHDHDSTSLKSGCIGENLFTKFMICGFGYSYSWER